MEYKKFISLQNGEDEKPLDYIPEDGGYCGIFRTIGCIGDSLSSGEFESTNEDGNTGYHDFYEYSWGQYIARMTGAKVYNFSCGGMTAKAYIDSFAQENDFWNEDKKCQCYIIGLGLNDLFGLKQEIGSTNDINTTDCEKNNETFCGYYARIIQRLKKIQPKAKFFLVTMPRKNEKEHDEVAAKHNELLYELAKFFDYTYVIDLFNNGPVHDCDFRRKFYLGNHLNPMGYMMSAKLIAAYIDFIIRHNPEDFAQVGFIGTPFHSSKAPW